MTEQPEQDVQVLRMEPKFEVKCKVKGCEDFRIVNIPSKILADSQARRHVAWHTKMAERKKGTP